MSSTTSTYPPPSELIRVSIRKGGVREGRVRKRDDHGAPAVTAATPGPVDPGIRRSCWRSVTDVRKLSVIVVEVHARTVHGPEADHTGASTGPTNTRHRN